MRKHIKVGITQGDFNGIGLEVTLKSIADETILELFTPVIFADWKLIEYARKTLDIDLPQIQKVADAADAADGRINEQPRLSRSRKLSPRSKRAPSMSL